jgi:hypothetical protein
MIRPLRKTVGRAQWPWRVLLAAAALSPALARAQETPTSAELRSPPAVSAPAPPTPVEPDAPPAPARFNAGRIPMLVTGGLAVVALGTGTVFGILSISDHSNFDAHPTTATANDGESHELTADMCFGVAATLAVATLVMALTHEDSPPPATSAPHVSISPIVSPRAAGVVVRF